MNQALLVHSCGGCEQRPRQTTMARLIKNRSIRKVLPPGGLNLGALSEDSTISGHYIKFNQSEILEDEFNPVKLTAIETWDKNFTHWFHIEGFGQEKFLKVIYETFHIPTFQMADVLNIDHHPKIEDLDDLLFFLLKSVELNESQGIERLAFHHMGIFLGEGFVLTFSEKPLSVFNLVKDRIRQKKGKIRDKKEDFLFYIFYTLRTKTLKVRIDFLLDI